MAMWLALVLLGGVAIYEIAFNLHIRSLQGHRCIDFFNYDTWMPWYFKPRATMPSYPIPAYTEDNGAEGLVIMFWIGNYKARVDLINRDGKLLNRDYGNFE